MMSINYAGVYLSAQACATQMIKYKISGSIVMVGSMSGTIANKGLLSSVYNCSKAAVGQLARNMAMEWGKVIDGKSIRVNVLAPGNVNTPVSWKEVESSAELDADCNRRWSRRTSRTSHILRRHGRRPT